MAQRSIELLGSAVLRQPATAVEKIDDELRRLIADMFETMYTAEGIGLAGPQVGVSRRVLVVDVKDPEPVRIALVNPTIVEKGRETEKGEEGCLSIPGVSAHVERPTTVTVEAMDERGEAMRIEATGLLARCLQHEIDHLDGVLFIDYLAPLKRSMLLKKYRQLQAEEKAEKQKGGAARRG